MTEKPNILVLFDIDGTLVDCGRVAGSAFSKAFRETFGVPCARFAPREVAGLTDAAILAEVIRRLELQVENYAAQRERTFALYARNLAEALARRPAKALPGAAGAIKTVLASPSHAVGLLTGSTAATAAIKLRSAGLDPNQFACAAYSEDGEARASLPPAARRRFSELFGRPPEVTIVIGDTPRDAEAALAAECRFIGVATGHYDRASLERAGARTVLDDLSRSDLVRSALKAEIKRP